MSRVAGIFIAVGIGFALIYFLVYGITQIQMDTAQRQNWQIGAA